MAAKAPIIVVKRIKKGGHGHHGGAWKVAYADFVTAMMVFFLLLWLLSSVPEETLQGIGNYFTPTLFDEASGIDPELELALKEKILEEGGIDDNDVSAIIEKRMAGFLQEKFGGSIRIAKVDDGIVLRLISSNKSKLFNDKDSLLLPKTKEKLRYILQLTRGLPYYVVISGHVDKKETSESTEEKWKVSLNRADAARRFLFTAGLSPEQLFSVVGKADVEGLPGSEQDYLINRRLEIKLLTKNGFKASI